MKKLIFLFLLISTFLTVVLFADPEKAEEKPDEEVRTEEKAETSGKIVARGLTTIEIPPHSSTVNGALDKKVIEEHVRKILPKLRFCYENGVRKHPEIAGIVVLDFVIQPTGDVSESKVVSTTMHDSGVEKCVAEQVGKIKFPVSKDAGTVVDNYSFVFRNAEVKEKVSDNNKTHLLWSDRSPEKLDWQGALNYCKNLSDGGFKDWRLPNIDELREIIENCSKTEVGGECRVSEKNGCLSSNCKNPKDSCNCERLNSQGVYSRFWDGGSIGLWSSSTLSDDANKIWGVVFYSAMIGSIGKNGKLYARCVRTSDETDKRSDETDKRKYVGKEAVVTGAIDTTVIDAYIRRNLVHIRDCYVKELKNNPKIAGRVLINFIISASGDVSSSKVQRTTLNNAELENCVAEQVKKIKFPKPKGGGIVIVNYPFTFKNGEN